MDEDKTQRAQRLAAALRANLHRRKQQTRRRTGDAEPQGNGEPHEPHSDKPHSDKPHSGKPHSGKHNGDKPGSDRNGGET